MYNPLFLEDNVVAAPGGAGELTTGDWIALRRLAAMQSLTDDQVQRLMRLGLAIKTLAGLACSERGRQTLQSRP